MAEIDNPREPQLGAENDAPAREVIIPKPRRPAGEGENHASRPWMLPIWLMIGGACVAGAGWAISDHLIDDGVSDAPVPFVEAEIGRAHV